MPPGHPPAEGGGGFFRPPADDVLHDQTLKPGIIDITIADADNKPIANAPIKLLVKEESVSRGEKSYTVDHATDGDGHLRLTDMKFGTEVSYIVRTNRGEASFETERFQLQDTQGIRVLLHAYEPVTDLAEAALVMEAVVMVEIKEDSFAISHRIRTLNLGRTAFVAKDVSMRLPTDFTAFNNEGEEGPVRMVEREGFAELQGTFAPGQSEVLFRYQLPLDGKSTQTLNVPLPPRVVHTTVVAGAGPDMKLDVGGFPKAEAERWHNGQRVLKTVHQPDMRFGLEPLLSNMSPRTIQITLSGIPTPGPERWLAVLLAVCGCIGGAVYFLRTRSRSVALSEEERADLREARDRLLDELTQLEKLHRKGDVGPQSYVRLRDALLDALARIVHKLELDEKQHPHRGKTRAKVKLKERAKEPAKERAKEPTKEQPKASVAASSEDASVKRKRRRKRKPKSATA
jgi:hypothetical protein